MKIVLMTTLFLSLSILTMRAVSQDYELQKLARDYVEQELQANPDNATELGDHRIDDRLTDYSPEARAKDLARQKEFREQLKALDGSKLSGAQDVALRIL